MHEEINLEDILNAHWRAEFDPDLLKFTFSVVPYDAQVLVTLNDGPKSMPQLRALVQDWMLLAERRLNGRSFDEVKSWQRFKGVLFGEQLEAEAYLCGALHGRRCWFSTPRTIFETALVLDEEWRRLCPLGRVELRMANEELDGRLYRARTCASTEGHERLIFPEDFWPRYIASTERHGRGPEPRINSLSDSGDRLDEKRLREDYEQQWGDDGRRRAAFVSFVAKQPCNTYITLAVNDGPKSMDKLRNILKSWLQGTEGRLLGKRYYKKEAKERITGVFVGEGLDTNAHLHGMLQLPDHLLETPDAHHEIWKVLDQEWRRVARKGTLQTNATDSAIGGAIYQTKEFKRPDFWARFVWAEDFWPATPTGFAPGRGC